MAAFGMCPSTVRIDLTKLTFSTIAIPSDALPVHASIESDKGISIGDQVEIAGLAIAIVFGIPAAVAAVLTVRTYLGLNSRQGPSEYSFRLLRERAMVVRRSSGM